tara:strand:+ start:119 stop:463 length:345 start_codon:yes stop_codon:yes gene_type:complete
VVQEILPQQLQLKELLVEMGDKIVRTLQVEVVEAEELRLQELVDNQQEIQVEMELQQKLQHHPSLIVEEAVEVIVDQDNQQVAQAVEEVEVLLVQQLNLELSILVVVEVEVMVV